MGGVEKVGGVAGPLGEVLGGRGKEWVWERVEGWMRGWERGEGVGFWGRGKRPGVWG